MLSLLCHALILSFFPVCFIITVITFLWLYVPVHYGEVSVCTPSPFEVPFMFSSRTPHSPAHVTHLGGG